MFTLLSRIVPLGVFLLAPILMAKPGSNGFFKNPGDAVLALDYQVDSTVCLQVVGKAKVLPFDFNPQFSVNGNAVTLLKEGMTAESQKSSQKSVVSGLELAGRNFKIEDKAFTVIKFCFDSSSVPVFIDSMEVTYTLSLAGNIGSVTGPNVFFQHAKLEGKQNTVPNFVFVVTTKDGSPAAGVEITLSGLNDNDNYTASVVVTDKNGIAEVNNLSLRPTFSLLMFSFYDDTTLRSGSFDVSDAGVLQQLKDMGSKIPLQLNSK